MIRRFQIEDLIVQDSSGVTFRALDTESGKPVALRRFFPFGADGGGLSEDEQTAYNIALDRLAGLSHPAMRAVVCGGCDPVDGMPFIATEWIEGDSLNLHLEQGPLSPDLAAELLIQALEVCELLSQVLAEEAVWVETDMPTIVVGNESSGRRFTFWISPLKWLGTGEEPRGLEAIVNLTEAIMGWQGQSVDNQAGRGLGGWLNWLRAAAATTTLHEARETLAASIGVEPPAPAKRLVTRAVMPPKTLKRRKPKAMLLMNTGLALLTLGLGGWLYVREGNRKGNLKLPAFLSFLVEKPAAEPAPSDLTENSAPASEAAAKPAPVSIESTPHRPAPAASGMSEAERAAKASQLAADLSSNKSQAATKNAETLAAQQTAVASQDGVYSPEHAAALLHQVDQQAEVEGMLESFDYSQSKKTMYLVFSVDSGWNAARGSILVANAPAELSENALKPLVGKKIRIKGKVDKQMVSGKSRPLVVIKDRASIEEKP